MCVCVCVCVWEGEYVETGNGAKIDGHVVEVRPHITVCVCVCVCVCGYVETGNGAKERHISGSRWTCSGQQTSLYFVCMCVWVGE